MPLKLAGITFEVIPDLVFTDNQPLPVIRGPLTVNARLTGEQARRLRQAIDDDERGVLETASGVGEVDVRSFVWAPEEGVVRTLEGLEVKSWKFR